MAPYAQTCPCKGRSVSAVKDARRYDSEAADIRREIALLERELQTATQRAARARHRALEGELGGCNLCGDTGRLDGNGSAQIGGSGRAGASLL